jgi:hypothetical protein
MRLDMHTGAVGQVFPSVFWVYLVSITPPMLQRHAALITSISGQNPETSEKRTMLFRISGFLGQKFSIRRQVSLHISFSISCLQISIIVE